MPAAALHGSGVTPDRVGRCAAAAGLPVWRAEGATADRTPERGNVVVLVGDGAGLEQPALWSPPFSGWIEIAGLDEGRLTEVVRRAAVQDVFASFTTRTANELHLAGRVIDALGAAVALTDVQRVDMELAIHEAISNAVVHGNLQVDGMKGLSVAALDRFSSDLAARIADPAFADRRVEVNVRLEPDVVTIEVGDEGSGFTPVPRDDEGASGRGLELIRAIAAECALLDGGRRIRMRFAL